MATEDSPIAPVLIMGLSCMVYTTTGALVHGSSCGGGVGREIP